MTHLLVSSKAKHIILPLLVLLGMFVFTQQTEARGGKNIFNGNPTEEKCRLCHGDDNNQPHPLLQEVNADKHHSRIGEPISGLGNGMYPTVAPGDTSSGEYDCFSCHSYNYDTYEIVLETDCLACHPKYSITGRPMRGGNVHHATQAFYSRQCRMCHGFTSSSGTGSSGRWSRGGRGMGGYRSSSSTSSTDSDTEYNDQSSNTYRQWNRRGGMRRR